MTNLEDNVLRKINQSQKDKYYMILLHEVSEIVKFIEAESRRVVARVRGRGSRELLFDRCQVLLCKMNTL